MSASDRVSDYARAFHEAAWERWLGCLQTIVDAIETQPEVRARLEASSLEFGQRQRVVDSLLPADTDQPVRNFIYAIMQQNDLPLLGAVLTALREHLRASGSGPTEVAVVSAVPLADDQRQTLQAKLQAQHGDSLDVHYRVDPAILGGLVVRVGDQLMDNSVASRLAAIRQALGVTTAD